VDRRLFTRRFALFPRTGNLFSCQRFVRQPDFASVVPEELDPIRKPAFAEKRN
jgi:hypothetical protein